MTQRNVVSEIMSILDSCTGWSLARKVGTLDIVKFNCLLTYMDKLEFMYAVREDLDEKRRDTNG